MAGSIVAAIIGHTVITQQASLPPHERTMIQCWLRRQLSHVTIHPLQSENLDARIHVLPYARFPTCALCREPVIHTQIPPSSSSLV